MRSTHTPSAVADGRARPTPILSSTDPTEAEVNPVALAQGAAMIEAAAQHLGLSAADAAEVAQSGSLVINGLATQVFVMGLLDDGAVQLLMFVNTGRTVSALGATAPRQVLFHSAGLLLNFGVGLSCSPDNEWLLCRSFSGTPGEDQALAEALRALALLADVVVPPAEQPADTQPWSGGV